MRRLRPLSYVLPLATVRAEFLGEEPSVRKIGPGEYVCVYGVRKV